MTNTDPRMSRRHVFRSEIPANSYPGPLHEHWRAAAAAKGFDLVARAEKPSHVVLRCRACDGIDEVRHSVLMSAQPLCYHCIEHARNRNAEKAGLILLRRDPRTTQYGYYRAPCGHEIRRQFGFVERIARGAVAPRCKDCLREREKAEARRRGWEWLARDPNGDTNYRLYRHHCGHEQRIARTNLQWGQCDCAGCGQSWTSKPSYLYLLDIRHGAQHFLKLGYSANPFKRHRHQLGLPKSARVKVLRVVAMRSGHEACAIEKKAHAQLSRTDPAAIVPPEDYANLLNVVSEIYHPWFAPELNKVLDQIEEGSARSLSASPAGGRARRPSKEPGS